VRLGSTVYQTFEGIQASNTPLPRR
jgi:hypothetical protein